MDDFEDHMNLNILYFFSGLNYLLDILNREAFNLFLNGSHLGVIRSLIFSHGDIADGKFAGLHLLLSDASVLIVISVYSTVDILQGVGIVKYSLFLLLAQFGQLLSLLTAGLFLHIPDLFIDLLNIFYIGIKLGCICSRYKLNGKIPAFDLLIIIIQEEYIQILLYRAGCYLER